MRRAAAFLLLAAPAYAAEPSLDPAEAVVLPRVLSAVPVEISADHNGRERAILMRNADADAASADLVILAGAPDPREGELIAVARGIVWAGMMAGQIPWLAVAPNGSLLVHAEQTGIGRSPWEETLTLAERQGQIRVAGYTLNQWDRITAGSARCDWNLLTGSWLLEAELPQQQGPSRSLHREGRDSRVVAVAGWTAEADSFPEICRVDLSAE